jgi:predicted acetyltransferase
MTSRRPDSRDAEIRAIDEDELGAWVRALDASFLLGTPDRAVAYCREFYTAGRSLGAFSARQCVGTLRSLDLELTVPGGAAVQAEGVTNVAVIAEHRRRGLLSQMMRVALDDAVSRGRGLAALIASEYRIYGRFGFGPATTAAAYDIDVRRAGDVRAARAGDGSVEQLSLDEVRRYGPALHERFRRVQVGAIARDHRAWQLITGEVRSPYWEWTEPKAVLYRDAGATPAAMALYQVDSRWRHGDPDFALTVRELLAVDPPAAAALWRHFMNVEWVTRVTAASLAPDDPLPLLLDNPRACVPQPGTGQDHLWLRVLDVPQALGARSYDTPGRLVLDVTDRLGYASGRFALEAGSDGSGSVRPAGEPADLALDVAALGSLYLGNQTVSRLAAAGLVAEQRAGGVSRADRLLRTAGRPWCPDDF